MEARPAVFSCGSLSCHPGEAKVFQNGAPARLPDRHGCHQPGTADNGRQD